MGKLSLRKNSSKKPSKLSSFILLLIVLITVLLIIRAMAATFFYVALGIAVLVLAFTAWHHWMKKDATA